MRHPSTNEFRILCYLCKSPKTYKQIAEYMTIDPRDARNYIQRLRGLVDGRRNGKLTEKEFFLTPAGDEVINQFIRLIF